MSTLNQSWVEFLRLTAVRCVAHWDWLSTESRVDYRQTGFCRIIVRRRKDYRRARAEGRAITSTIDRPDDGGDRCTRPQLGVFRLALADRPDFAALFGPIGLASQAGLVRATRGPAARRPFWFGFMVGGVCALIGSLWLELARPGPVVDLWVAYLARLDSQFGRLPRLGMSNPGHGLLHFAVVAAFFFPAQLLLASVSGMLGLALGKRGIRRQGRVSSGRTA